MVGGSVTSRIYQGGDQDWFAITLEADQWYRLDLKGSETGDGTLDGLRITGIYDSSGDLTGTMRDLNFAASGQNHPVIFKASQAGTHYIGAEGYWGFDVGTYTLSVEEIDPPPADLAANTTTTGTVAVGGTVTGRIEDRGDEDWFAVELEAGRLYQVDMRASSTDEGTLWSPHINGIYSSTGVFIEGTRDPTGGWDDFAGEVHNWGATGRNSRVRVTPTESGTHYIEATPFTRSDIGTYIVEVTDLSTRDDYGESTSDALSVGTLAVGDSVTGGVQFSGDHDWFAVTLEADKTYRIDMKGASTGDGTLWEPCIHAVYNADGTRIDGTDNHLGGVGSNGRLDFTPPTTGTYYISAGAYSTGTYTLALSVLTEEVSDDHSADTTTTGTVAVGGSATGIIEEGGDHDWFAVTLEANKTYVIDLKGSPNGDGTLSDPYLRGIHDANGDLVDGTTNDDGGFGNNSQVTFTSSAAGTYYVAAGALSGLTGTYTLSVTEAPASPTQPEDDYPHDTTTTGQAVVGGSVTGSIENGRDQDWFAVELQAGARYQFDLKGSATGDGSLGNPYLNGIYDAAGTRIAGTIDNNSGTGYNAQVSFLAVAAGTYYVAAGSGGTDTGTYTLSVTETSAPPTQPEDDYPRNTATTGRVVVGGSVTGNIENGRDQDWFAVELQAGQLYRFDLKGSGTGDGSLGNPYLNGIYDATSSRIANTIDNNSGEGYNAQVQLLAAETGTYYAAAGSGGTDTGTYTLYVEEVI